jgi:processive 1,2-diacylglycerol beta-glucosyltransferase
VCKEPSQLKKIIEELLSNNAEKLNKIKEAQKNFLNPNIAKEIVDFILSMEKRGDINIPDNLPKFWDFGKRSVVGRKIIINRHNKTLR